MGRPGVHREEEEEPERSCLNHAVHEVLLSNVVLALHNLLHDPGQHVELIHADPHALELAQEHQVLPNEVRKLLALLFSPLLCIQAGTGRG